MNRLTISLLIWTASALFSFSFAQTRGSARGFSIVPAENENRVDVFYNSLLITSYLYPDTLDKPVLYPLNTLNGVEVTRGYPLAPRIHERVDHPHHVGVWFNYGDVNGLDFWNNSSAIAPEKKDKYGSVRHKDILKTESERNGATLVTVSDWVDHAGNILLQEETTYLFKKEDVYLTVERQTVLTAVADSVVLKDNKEGMFAIRVAREFEEKTEKEDYFVGRNRQPTETKIKSDGNANGLYHNSEGDEGGNVWGKPARWVSLSAEKDGVPITIAIFDHPDNPGYPAYSHARGYGLFATNNLGRQAFDKTKEPLQFLISKPEKMQFRHKIVIKSGEFASDDELNALHHEYK